MKVAHIDTATTWRGGEKQVLSLAEGLRNAGHDVLVVCPPGSELEAVHGPPSPGEQRRSSIDSSRLASSLGAAPRTSLAEGLQRTVDWFRAQSPE